MLLCYNICQSLVASLFLSNFCLIPDLYAKNPAFYVKVPDLYAKIPALYADIFLCGFHCAVNVHVRFPIGCLWYLANDSTRAMCGQGGRVGARWWGEMCANVRVKFFWREIYCSELRPDPESQSGSYFRRRLERKSPWIMSKYDLATAISIRRLNHLCKCEMGSLSFSAMSRLKFDSTTSASFPSISYTERTDKEIHCLWQFLPYLSLFSFSQRSRSLSIGSYL